METGGLGAAIPAAISEPGIGYPISLEASNTCDTRSYGARRSSCTRSH